MGKPFLGKYDQLPGCFSYTKHLSEFRSEASNKDEKPKDLLFKVSNNLTDVVELVDQISSK